MPRLSFHAPASRKEQWRWIVDEMMAIAGNRPEVHEQEMPEEGLWEGDRHVLDGAELDRLFDTLSLKLERTLGRDDHGRVDECCITKDLVRPWISRRARELFGSGENPGFRVLMTHDVDRTTGLESTSLIKAGMRSLLGKRNHWLGLSQALRPGHMERCLRKLLDLEKHEGVLATYFMIAGPAGLGRYDSRTDIRWLSSRRSLQAILQAGAAVGLHGSYFARDRHLYSSERKRIEDLSGQSIRLHRNHYLRLDTERFCSQLEDAELQMDMSLGFVRRSLFRNGVADVFRAWNLEQDAVSNLFCVPLVFMEDPTAVARPEKMLQRLESVLGEAATGGGTVSVLIHPEVFAVDDRWYDIYREMIGICRRLGADLAAEPLKILEQERNRRCL